MIGKPFEKGKSGNPGGRPRVVADIQELARKHCPNAIKRLAAIAEGDDVRAAVAACNSLLDRGYGKPVQQLNHSGSMSLEQIIAGCNDSN